MPWCPKCKTEYCEGVSVCADCGEALTDSLDDITETVPLAYMESGELADKLTRYLQFENIKSECGYDEESCAFCVSVDKDRLRQAQAAFSAFYKVESQNELKEKLVSAAAKLKDSDPEDEPDAEAAAQAAEKVLDGLPSKPAGVYVKKADESRDMMSTAVTFTAFGALLLVFMVLNAAEVITWFSNLMSLIVLSVLGVGCMIVGLNAVGRAKRAAAQAVDEEQATKKINGWMEQNITEGFLQAADDPASTAELNYLRRTEAIKGALVKEFGELDDSYLDAIIEDFYNTHIDVQENEYP